MKRPAHATRAACAARKAPPSPAVRPPCRPPPALPRWPAPAGDLAGQSASWPAHETDVRSHQWAPEADARIQRCRKNGKASRGMREGRQLGLKASYEGPGVTDVR